MMSIYIFLVATLQIKYEVLKVLCRGFIGLQKSHFVFTIAHVLDLHVCNKTVTFAV